jgi:DNA-binding response OmpR family regulator
MGRHILIVEDEDAIAAFAATTLEREGYTTSRACIGEDALAQLLNHHSSKRSRGARPWRA